MSNIKIDKKIGRRLFALRASANLTQQALADELGVKRETIEQWEVGTRHIKAEHIASMARFFQVPSDYILGLRLESRTAELLADYADRERTKQTIKRENMSNLTKNEAFILAKYIDKDTIHMNSDCVCSQDFKTLIHGYGKLCLLGGYTRTAEADTEVEQWLDE